MTYLEYHMLHSNSRENKDGRQHCILASRAILFMGHIRGRALTYFEWCYFWSKLFPGCCLLVLPHTKRYGCQGCNSCFASFSRKMMCCLLNDGQRARRGAAWTGMRRAGVETGEHRLAVLRLQLPLLVVSGLLFRGYFVPVLAPTA